jgi:hypothetical protein
MKGSTSSNEVESMSTSFVVFELLIKLLFGQPYRAECEKGVLITSHSLKVQTIFHLNSEERTRQFVDVTACIPCKNAKVPHPSANS